MGPLRADGEAGAGPSEIQLAPQIDPQALFYLLHLSNMSTPLFPVHKSSPLREWSVTITVSLTGQAVQGLLSFYQNCELDRTVLASTILAGSFLHFHNPPHTHIHKYKSRLYTICIGMWECWWLWWQWWRHCCLIVAKLITTSGAFF